MAHLVGASVRIPGDAWQPKQDKDTAGAVLHFARPTRGYPEGRIRILCDDGTDVWWDVAKLPAEWITSLPPDTIPQSPTSVVHATPSRASRRTNAVTPSTAGRTRSRRQSTRAPAVDGYDSSTAGAGLLSDGDGAAERIAQPLSPAIKPTPVGTSPAGTVGLELAPAGGMESVGILLSDGEQQAAVAPPTTGLARRSARLRKSLRFAPGTISPGGAAVAVAVPAASAPVGSFPPPPYAATSTASAPLFFEIDAETEIDTAVHSTPLRGVTAETDIDADVAFASATEPPSTAFTAFPPSSAPSSSSSSAVPTLPWEQRLRNTVLMVLVTLPALYFFHYLRSSCSAEQQLRPLGPFTDALLRSGDVSGVLRSSDFWCAVGFQQPLVAVNLVFFLNVGVLFWLISLVQGSTWLIDPFWTIAPMMIALFYQHHPAASTDPLRSRLSMGLMWLWAARLTHSYFRREEWQVGAREDWRYAHMARRLGRLRWAFASFFAVGVAQQLMLVGLTLPILAIHTSSAPWSPLVDSAIFLSAATGIMVALTADNQLRKFVVDNEKRVAKGRSPLLLLDTGLWRYSRHPNFFGEQLWWWSLAAWAVLCGQPWMVVGAAFNSICFIPITLMTEQRMLQRPERADLYRHYQKTTSVWVPWFPRAARL
ncbi:hypothetical protein Agub_g8968 [Astrephomene gubernaculifera]|uniref:Steroid 5-alpha reductase C-terminal domain-containing protein n=1 Tax=Astrephomene gubernaculifera TaxID=47775 RepID=A0AAD3DWX8_9CHLO|nr:hypothetical protein Agub_g8968 [Astrephomene gubernaculifera]